MEFIWLGVGGGEYFNQFENGAERGPSTALIPLD